MTPRVNANGLVLTLLVLTSCLNPTNTLRDAPGGSLFVSATGNARSILPSGTFLASYQARGTGPSGAQTTTQTSSDGSFAFDDLVPGSWTFTVQGLDSGDAAIASGSKTLTITSAGGQSANITLAPIATGTGTLSLSIAWPSTRPVTSVAGTLTSEGGTSTPVTLSNLTSTGGAFSGGFSPGSYVLALEAKNGSSVIASSRLEAVQIYRGHTSSWSATIADNQFLSGSKDISAFTFASPAATGAITGTNITVNVPTGTNVTALVPTLSIPSDASVSPASGVAQNFTSPVPYTVTAADGSTQTYTVTVTVLGSAGITVTDPPSVTVSLSAPSTINYGSVITATPSTTVDSYAWYLDGALVAGQTGASLTVGTSLTLGAHSVMVAVKKSGVLFSQSHDFTVASLLGGLTLGKVLSLPAAVTPWAGTEESPGTNEGVGLGARFYSPYAMTTDGTSLYVASAGSHLIQRVDLATGIVTNFAGTPGSAGDADGTGTLAQFRTPVGLTTDGTNLYVADGYNHILRKIVIATREVSLLAGSPGNPGTDEGTGTSARFYHPHGITTDGSYLYVTDLTSNLVRRVDIVSGQVDTFAGSGTKGNVNATGTEAQFDGPVAITTDGAHLYVVELGGRVVRKIDIATRAVETLAGQYGVSGSADGTGTAAQFNGPEGITTDGVYLYVSDGGSVRRVEIATGKVLTPPVTKDVFLHPRGLVSDGTSLYVCDAGRHVIRKID